MNLDYRQPIDRRPALLLTVLVHVALVAGWQMLRSLPAPPAGQDEARSRIFWIPLPVPRPAAPDKAVDKAPKPPRKEALPARPQPATAIVQPPMTATPAPAPAPATEAVTPAQPLDAKPTAQQILERAKRDVGGIAKALRKENNPYIAAPLDSPQMRLQRGIEEAHAMAPNRIWEAPKVEELVNNTGDGARRSRVISGNGTYCVTERATNTSIDMIEKHGKTRITSCPEHEAPATRQAWRTLRD